MFDCTLEGFALSQMQIAAMCKKDKVSEADTIEKLIVPVLNRLYKRPLFFERASRASRGKSGRKWDLQYYEYDDMALSYKTPALGYVECKSVCERFRARINGNLQWDYSNVTKKFGSVRKYIQGGDTQKCNVDAHGDMPLQVWIYGNCESFGQRHAGTKILWSNGIVWCIFDDRFFNGDNPHPGIRFDNVGNVKSTTGFLEVVTFPQCLFVEWAQDGLHDKAKEWGANFCALQHILGIRTEP